MLDIITGPFVMPICIYWKILGMLWRDITKRLKRIQLSDHVHHLLFLILQMSNKHDIVTRKLPHLKHRIIYWIVNFLVLFSKIHNLLSFR